MKKLIQYFYPKEETSYFDQLKTNFFIIQAFIIVPILSVFIIQSLVSPNENFIISFFSRIVFCLFLITSLYIVKHKGIKTAGNIFSVVVVLIVIISMNILREDIPVMYKYIHGFYSIFAIFAYGLLFANRTILLINAGLFFMTTTHIYLFAIAQSPENAMLFKTGYINHSFTIIFITMIFFFVHKFTELAVNKANNENEIQKQQNKELIIAQEKIKENEAKLKIQNAELDEKVNIRTAELQESNATKDKFFSIIAHDLRGPFNSMVGFIELLIENFDKYETSKQKEYINHINQSVQSSYKLLENLLLWSRAQRKTIEFNPSKENLFFLAEEIIDISRQAAEKKSISLLNLIDKNIDINIDKNMIATTMRNLISNAIKFTPQKGKITLEARSISDEGKQNDVEITVKDTGLGIAPERQAKLFKISENISTKGTEKETGTGLGLILCKEFVERHGGKIWVESEVGEGSKFIFTLYQKTKLL